MRLEQKTRLTIQVYLPFLLPSHFAYHSPRLLGEHSLTNLIPNDKMQLLQPRGPVL